jgi:hypothetical protein
MSSAQPPRVMFVVERMPDAFHRKVKQLGFPDIDCVEFRYLDIDGRPAVYFESLARLRRASAIGAPEAVASAPSAAWTAAPPQEAPPAGRPTSVKLQKLLAAERPAPPREPAQVVTLRHRAGLRAEPPKAVASAPVTRPEPQLVDEPETPALEPTAPTSEDAVGGRHADEPSESSAASAPVAAVIETIAPRPDAPLELNGTTTAGTIEPDALGFEPTTIASTETEPLEAPTSVTPAELNVEPIVDLHELEPMPSANTPAPAVESLPPAPEPVVAEASVFARRAPDERTGEDARVSFANVAKELLPVTPTPAAVTDQSPAATEDRPSGFSAFAKPGGLKRPRTIAPPPPDPQPIVAGPKLGAATPRTSPPAVKLETSVAAPAQAEPAPTPTAATFDGVQFPNDGVLTRQWMEFLNQMAAGK